MTTTNRSRGDLIRLSRADGDVIVEPDDEDRFAITAQSAVQASQERRRQEEPIQSFKRDLLAPLIEWCEGRSGKVRACYLPVPVGHIQVFVIGTSSKFDFDLGDEVAALELRLANAGWRVCILQLPAAPEEEHRAFFRTQNTLEVYAQLQTAPGEGQP